jgi:hypothetical protein
MNDNYNLFTLGFVLFVTAISILAIGPAAVQALPTDVEITHAPANPTTADAVTFVATAFDTAGISRIRIFIDGVKEAVCLDSLCVLDYGQMAEGSHTYQARAVNGNGDITRSDVFFFDVVPESPPGPDPDPQPGTCGVEITGLDVSGGIIYYSIENTGSGAETIDYTVKINTNVIQTGSFSLSSNSVKSDHIGYSFGYDSYVITLQADTDCGVNDAQTITHSVFRPYSCLDPLGFEGEYRCDYSLDRRLKCIDSYWVEVSGFYDHCEDRDDDCTSRWLDQYRCDGDVIQRRYRYSDCDTSWRNWEVCDYDCYRGYCTDYYGYRYDYGRCSSGWICTDYYHRAYQDSNCDLGQSYYCPNGCTSGACRSSGIVYPPVTPTYQCGVSIEEFDFSDTVGVGNRATATFTARNTGRSSQTMTFQVYVDSQLEDSHKVTAGSGASFTKTFDFYPDVGLHNIEVKARVDCGKIDSRRAQVRVESGFIPDPSPQPSISVTDVDVSPNQIDLEPFESKVFAIEIKSAVTQSFTIDISGMDADWLSYPSSVSVSKGTKRVYVYVSPQKDGVYPLNIKVRSLSQGDEFSRVVRVYVSPLDDVECEGCIVIQAAPASASSVSGASGTGQVTGLVVAGDYPYWFALFIVVAIVVGYFVAREYRDKKQGRTEGFAATEVNSKTYPYQ